MDAKVVVMKRLAGLCAAAFAAIIPLKSDDQGVQGSELHERSDCENALATSRYRGTPGM
jgi:hypothetical protein